MPQRRQLAGLEQAARVGQRTALAARDPTPRVPAAAPPARDGPPLDQPVRGRIRAQLRRDLRDRSATASADAKVDEEQRPVPGLGHARLAVDE